MTYLSGRGGNRRELWPNPDLQYMIDKWQSYIMHTVPSAMLCV